MNGARTQVKFMVLLCQTRLCQSKSIEASSRVAANGCQCLFVVAALAQQSGLPVLKLDVPGPDHAKPTSLMTYD